MLALQLIKSLFLERYYVHGMCINSILALQHDVRNQGDEDARHPAEAPCQIDYKWCSNGERGANESKEATPHWGTSLLKKRLHPVGRHRALSICLL